MFSCNVVSCWAQLVSFLNCLQDVSLSRTAIHRDEFRRMNCSLNWSFISCGELHCDSVKIKTQLVFLKTMRVFGLERLFGCFVIVGYSFPEERSRASNQGVFLIFTVFSGRRFLFSLPAPSPLPLTRPISSSLREVSTWRFREQIARSKKTPALQANQRLTRVSFSFVKKHFFG